MADVSHGSITLSSHSYASSVFPLLDGTTASLIEEIVSRVSSHQNDWKAVLHSYKEVFAEKDLDGEKDVFVYGLLLRLGMERGGDWKAKWEGVKRAQQTQQQSQDDVSRYPAATRAPYIQEPATARAAPPSHLSEAYRTPLRSRLEPRPTQTIEEAEHADETPLQRLTKEALAELQNTSSPYKRVRADFTHARHGYKQSHNDDGEPQHRHGARSPPPVPTVHFAELPLRGADDGDDRVHLQREGILQDTRYLDLHGIHIVPTYHRVTHEQKEEMRHLSIRFRTTALQRRMFQDWRTRFLVLQRINFQTTRARDTLLQRHALQFWVERLRTHKALDIATRRVSNNALLRKSLWAWHDKCLVKKKLEWQRDMTVAYRSVVRKKDRQIKESALQVSRGSCDYQIDEPLLTLERPSRDICAGVASGCPRLQVPTLPQGDTLATHFVQMAPAECHSGRARTRSRPTPSSDRCSHGLESPTALASQGHPSSAREADTACSRTKYLASRLANVANTIVRTGPFAHASSRHTH